MNNTKLRLVRVVPYFNRLSFRAPTGWLVASLSMAGGLSSNG